MPDALLPVVASAVALLIGLVVVLRLLRKPAKPPLLPRIPTTYSRPSPSKIKPPRSPLPAASLNREHLDKPCHPEVFGCSSSGVEEPPPALQPAPTSATAPAAFSPPAAAPLAAAVAPPSSVDDKRPDVRALLSSHAEQLLKLRQLVAVDPLYDDQRHDELWLLRYLLSHKSKVSAAATAARSTLAWRAANQMDQLAAELVDINGVDHPVSIAAHREYVTPGAIQFLHPDPTRGPILIATMAMLDYNAAMRLSREQYFRSTLVMMEWFYIRCDAVTRLTGRLTKSARFVQIRGFKMRSLNRDWLSMDAAMAKEIEDHYPQAVAHIFCLDPPQWALALWRVVKVLFPARLIEKIDLIATSNREMESKAQCFISLDHLPASHGGRKQA